MKLHPSEMWLYFNCKDSSHKKTRAMAYAISDHVNEFTFKENKLSKYVWKDILNMLNMAPKELLNKADPVYQEKIRGHEFDDEGWLDVLANNPCLVKAPIAIYKNKAVFCINPKDIFKLAREEHAMF